MGIPALAFAAPVAAPTETPVMVLFRDWIKHNDWLNSSATAGMSNKEFDGHCDDDRAIVREILAQPSVNSGDVLMKIMALTDWGRDLDFYGVTNCDWIGPEARALIAA